MEHPFPPYVGVDASIPVTAEETSPAERLEEENEAKRKALSRKRLTYFLIVIGVILLGLIVWELVDAFSRIG